MDDRQFCACRIIGMDFEEVSCFLPAKKDADCMERIIED